MPSDDQFHWDYIRQQQLEDVVKVTCIIFYKYMKIQNYFQIKVSKVMQARMSHIIKLGGNKHRKVIVDKMLYNKDQHKEEKGWRKGSGIQSAAENAGRGQDMESRGKIYILKRVLVKGAWGASPSPAFMVSSMW